MGDEDSQKLMLALNMTEQDEEGNIRYRRTTVRHPMTRQCCRKAYLRAAYLGSGTMSNPEKEYHFEVSATDQSLVRELGRLLEKSGLPVNTYQRKGQTVVYLKGAQQISDAMALMGATNSVFSLEDIRIRKQARGAANRAINCDEYNFQRMLDAADSQVEGIRRYVIVKGMRSLPPALQEIAQKRLDNADLSLVELGQLFEPPLTKSAVNHRMRRLMDIVREHEAQLIQEFSETQEEQP